MKRDVRRSSGLERLADVLDQALREDSPRHPPVRLFRQAQAGDWDGVVEAVGRALVELRSGRAVAEAKTSAAYNGA